MYGLDVKCCLVLTHYQLTNSDISVEKWSDVCCKVGIQAFEQDQAYLLFRAKYPVQDLADGVCYYPTQDHECPYKVGRVRSDSQTIP